MTEGAEGGVERGLEEEGVWEGEGSQRKGGKSTLALHVSLHLLCHMH